ncbi:hypothetical protein OAQ16_03880 [Flavobacteriales bacterium]|nr:hypothetical protein [Flavobacteriales bacterium]|tara:strand:- start:153 stop:506 length:354 start_codon:yes stop_codon:yes gene_type:complete
MKNFLFCLLFFPLFSFASFPIETDFQSLDTIIRNGKIYVDVGVDSLSKYPVEKETLTEYRARLKKQFNQENSSNNTANEKKPVDWTKIIIIFLVIGAVMSYILMKLMFDSINSSSWW